MFFYDKFPLQGARNKTSRKAIAQEIADKVDADPKAGLVWDPIEQSWVEDL